MLSASHHGGRGFETQFITLFLAGCMRDKGTVPMTPVKMPDFKLCFSP